MGDESSGLSGETSMRSSVVRGETELFRSQAAQLYLIDGEESVLLQTGDFALFLVRHSRSPLAAVVAVVGDMQWPVGKDSPVMRVGSTSFTFALPGLTYGLVVANGTAAADVQRLEALLQEYAIYEVHLEINPGMQLEEAQRQAAGYWTKMAPEVERRSARMARQVQQRGRGGAAAAAASSSSSGGITKGGQMAALSLQREERRAGVGGVSARIMKRMQQARRVSAVAKLFSKTLERGAISAASHVEAAAVAGGGGLAVASVDAVAKVVDAVETAGRALLETATLAGAERAQRRCGGDAGVAAAEGLGPVGDVIDSAWTLNKLGLRMLFRAIAASTAIHSARSSSSSSELSGASSSSGGRLLSSSSTSGSVSPPAIARLTPPPLPEQAPPPPVRQPAAVRRPRPGGPPPPAPLSFRPPPVVPAPPRPARDPHQ